MAYIYDLVDTWNNSGVTFTAIKMNVTDTASSASSMLMDLQVGGVSRFAVRKDGFIQIGSSSTGISNYFSTVGIYQGGTLAAAIGSTGGVRTQTVFTFGNSEDVILSRRGAGNLRLGAADAASAVAQILSVQSVVAGTTNGAGANFTITGSQGTGTGAGGSIIFQVAPPSGTSGSSQNSLVTAMTIASDRNVTFDVGINTPALRPTSGNDLVFNGASVGAAWRINTAGNFIAHTDNTYDIGATSGNRPRNAYIYGNIITTVGSLYLYGTSGTRLQADAGAFYIDNQSNQNGFVFKQIGDVPVVKFGGTTSAFPALKRSGTTLQVRLADDSAAANLTAARIGAGTENPQAALHVIGDSILAGNLTVTGTTTYMNTATLLVGDNIVVLNADLPNTASAVESSGIEVNRGSSGNASIIWDETSSEWDIRANNTTVAAFTQSGSIKANTGVALTTNSPVLDLAQTWNNSGVTFTGIKLNVTDTASNTSSLLMDFQVGGVSKANFRKDGSLATNVGGGNPINIRMSDAYGTAEIAGVSGGIRFKPSGSSSSAAVSWSGNFLSSSTGAYSFLPGSDFSQSIGDTILTRRGAASLRLGAADTSASATITVTIASPGVVTWTNHGLTTGSPVIFTTTGALPTGITAGTTYYAIVVDTNPYASTFQLATSFANALSGTAINTSGSQSGTHTGRRGAVSQTFGPQDTLSTSSLENIDGANFVIRGSRSIGDKPGGSIVFQVSPAGASGTAQNALMDALTINSSRQAIFSTEGTAVAPVIAFGTASNAGLFMNGANFVYAYSGTARAAFTVRSGIVGVTVPNDGAFSFSSTSVPYGVDGDVLLRRDDANVLALRNSTNAQAFRLYNTYTDASNYERLRIQWSSSDAIISTEAAGTGVNRPLFLRGQSLFLAGAVGANHWRIDTSGNFLAQTDNFYDIGASGANRPRAIYTSGNISVGNDLLMNMSIGANINFGAGYGSINRGYSGSHTFCLSPGSSLNFAVEVVSTTNPMSFRVYNTFTDPSNYERGFMRWNSNVLQIGTEKAGTGVARDVTIQRDGTDRIVVGSSSITLGTSSTNMTLWTGDTTFNKTTNYLDGQNIGIGTTTGTKIGTANTQKIGFWNATPIVQPNTSIAAATVASTGTGDVVAATTTFDGYTIPQIVKALRNAGLLA